MYFDHAWLSVWLGLGTDNTCLGLGKDCVSVYLVSSLQSQLKNIWVCATYTARKCKDDFLGTFEY